MLEEPNSVSTRKWTRYVSTNTQEEMLTWPQVYEIYEKEYDTLIDYIDSTTLSEQEKVLEKAIFSLAFLFSYLPVEERENVIDFLDSDAICSFPKHSAPDSPIEKCKSV